jgi:hypothetical protein
MTKTFVLWLPIVLSSVFVFVVSAVIHMALQWWHKSDYGKVAQEDKLMDALRPFGIPPGDYMVPNCVNSAEFKTAEFQEKLKRGPVVLFTVMPNGAMHMGKSLGLWFLYLLAVSYLTGYVALHQFHGWVGYRNMIPILGVTSFMGYSAALWQMSIWYRRSFVTTIKATIDGLLYASVTAATFAWLWPR